MSGPKDARRISKGHFVVLRASYATSALRFGRGKTNIPGCSATSYRSGALSHKTTHVQATRGLRFLTLASYFTDWLEGTMVVSLAKQIIVLFIMMFCGFALVKMNYLKTEDNRVLTVLSVRLLYPCVIIGAFQIDYTPEIRDGFILAVVAAVLIQVILLILSSLFRKMFSLSPVETASVFYSNSANMVIPLVTAVLGSEWLIYTSAFICVQTCVIWVHGQALIAGNGDRSLKKIFLNPNVLASILGIVLFLARVRMPEVLESAISGMGNVVGPISMFIIGALLAAADWKKVLLNKRLWLVSVIRLVIIPIFILLFLKYSGLAALAEKGSEILMISLLAAVAPTAATVVQIAQLYDREAVYAGQINALTTLLSVVTMPLMVMLYLL